MLECEACKAYGYQFDVISNKSAFNNILNFKLSPKYPRAIRTHIESEIHTKSTKCKAY
ncbi:unnamed protein product [Meloidogyne enterolobii]|uniref:Uncharacterized protein n=1 Tax=Meloidogyne enterolobii TaxID=390850 RepID=A0ACB1AWY6_MELEN